MRRLGTPRSACARFTSSRCPDAGLVGEDVVLQLGNLGTRAAAGVTRSPTSTLIAFMSGIRRRFC